MVIRLSGKRISTIKAGDRKFTTMPGSTFFSQRSAWLCTHTITTIGMTDEV